MANDHPVPTEAVAVVDFWTAAGPRRWFAKDAAFDAEFRERFAAQHEAAARGELKDWLRTATGALALVLLLDQYPRNSFRGTARMFASDALAREAANAAIAAGHDRAVGDELASFFYLPFEHSEGLADQEKAMALCERLGGEAFKYAVIHRDVIQRFGRFPHRNAILGRATTPEEEQFMKGGGFAG